LRFVRRERRKARSLRARTRIVGRPVEKRQPGSLPLASRQLRCPPSPPHRQRSPHRSSRGRGAAFIQRFRGGGHVGLPRGGRRRGGPGEVSGVNTDQPSTCASEPPISRALQRNLVPACR
jgi:hypothetical protein